MAAAPITIKLRCKSWGQLKSIYERDLCRGALFLKSRKPPPLGTRMRIDLSLPSDSLIVLNGTVTTHVEPGALDGRGPGIDIALDAMPQSALWLIETALRSAADRDEPAPAASMEDGADVADAEGDLVGALRQEHASLARLNPFQILDVEYDADDARVRAAFGDLTRKYHPDRFARYQSREARKYASEIFILIRDAYRKLGTEKARAQTLRLLEARRATPTRGTRPTSPPRPPRHGAAPQAPVTGEPVKGGPAAAPAFTPRPASRARPGGDTSALGDDLFADAPPQQADSRAAAPIDLGPGRSRAPRQSFSEADRLLDRGEYEQALHIYQTGARRDPGDRTARAGVELAEGLRALVQRDRLEAAQRFEAVLELDPSNERAARELAEMRRIATTERKGLLARLLGKKE